MKKMSLLLILLLIPINIVENAPTSEDICIDITPITRLTTKYQDVCLENFTFKSIDPGYPLSINHIGDIDDDSNFDMIGYNLTHNIKFEYNVTTGTFNSEPFGNRSDLYLPKNYKLIDLDGNNRLNAMADNYSLYEWNNGTFILTGINNIGGTVRPPSYGDVDSDGDVDLLTGARPDGIYIIRNKINGSFYYETTNRSGLPEFTGHPSRQYEALSYMYEDLNNDGWLDICTGMGDRYGRYPGQDYFWLSNGDGSWVEFSEGGPTWDYGLDIDSADLDNDGDQDFLLNMKYNKTTIFQNNYPDEWKLIHLPRSDELSGFFDSDFQIGDLNNDGYDDICISYYKEIRDDNDIVIDTIDRIGIYYNNGNLSFEADMSNEFEINGLRLFPLLDLDQDGSLDIIISPTNARTDGWSPFVLFNNHQNSNELELMPSWGSDTLRAGSYLNFNLMSKKMNLYHDMSVNFNISISYFGINGPYSPLIQNLLKWWTYWTVPNFPSNDAYLKIEGMGMMTHYGPLTIYSKNNSKYLIEASFSVSGNYLYGGREVDVFLKPDPNLVETLSIDLTLEYANGTFDLGSHLVDPGATTSFRWTVPIDLFELDCRLIQNLSFRGREVVIVGDEGYNILDDDVFLEDVSGDDALTTWRGYASYLDLECLSKNYNNLTHSSKFKVASTSAHFIATHMGEGRIQIIGSEVGQDWLMVDIECFGVEKTFSSYITVENSIGTLNISRIEEEVHTGDVAVLSLTMLDLVNDTVILTIDDINCNLSGPGIVSFFNYDQIGVLCNGTGTIQVSVEANLGYGSVGDIYSFEVLPFITDVRLSLMGPVVIDHEVEIIAKMYDWDGEVHSDLILSWNVSGNASFRYTTYNDIKVTPYDDKPIFIELHTHYFDEIITRSFQLWANLSLSGIKTSYQKLDIPLGGTEYIEVIPLTFNGSIYPFDVNIEFIKENPEILSHRVDENRIMLVGLKAGTTDVEIRVKTPYDQVSTNLTIYVHNIPYDVIMHSTTSLVRKVDHHLDFEIVDRSLNLLPNNSYELNIENATFSSDHDKWNVIAFECGTFGITFNVKMENITLVKMFVFTVFPYWDHMDYSEIKYHVREGDELRIEPILVLENGNITGLTDLHIVSETILDIEYDLDGAIIEEVPCGPLVFSIRGSYLGIPVEGEFKLNILEKPILTHINITFHNSTEEIIVEVTAFDQYGINITDLCTFHYVGDTVSISDNIVRVLSDRLTVLVSLNDEEISKEVEINSGNSERCIEPMALFLITMVILIVVILLVSVIAWKYRFISYNRKYVIDAPQIPEE